MKKSDLKKWLRGLGWTVVSFESVGAFLVVGMLIIPAATAYLLTDRLSSMICISILIGALISILGYFAAFWLNSSISGCMIAAAALLFAIAFVLSPKHGLVSRAMNQRKSRKKAFFISE
ncbi:metal ABC transporter permease [Bacillus massiliglaciei]|uniref:metal ABC transporter permease n=1 Tax=Bacillus massiliglaciei TaxID=1816693 RepID=UPI000ABDB043|nr:metal ABC transporter permease [Bacillus massiliglaciei]